MKNFAPSAGSKIQNLFSAARKCAVVDWVEICLVNTCVPVILLFLAETYILAAIHLKGSSLQTE